jgi:hypothetical protein
MSSIPGYTLEDFLEDELYGAIPSVEMVALCEPYRESVEYALDDFDQETQSWRDYSSGVADHIPEKVWFKIEELWVGKV